MIFYNTAMNERSIIAANFIIKSLYLRCRKVDDNKHQRWSRGHKARGQGQGQGQPFRGQTLSRPRTGMLEAKAKDTSASALQKKKKKGLHKNFLRDLQKK